MRVDNIRSSLWFGLSIQRRFRNHLLQLQFQGKFEEALDYYKEAYRHKKNDQILLNLARLNQQMHEMDEAIVYYEELIKENPNIKEAYLELADIYVHEQQPVKAAQLLNKRLKKILIMCIFTYI